MHVRQTTKSIGLITGGCNGWHGALQVRSVTGDPVRSWRFSRAPCKIRLFMPLIIRETRQTCVCLCVCVRACVFAVMWIPELTPPTAFRNHKSSRCRWKWKQEPANYKAFRIISINLSSCWCQLAARRDRSKTLCSFFFSSREREQKKKVSK